MAAGRCYAAAYSRIRAEVSASGFQVPAGINGAVRISVLEPMSPPEQKSLYA
jgi:hypothetical protein